MKLPPSKAEIRRRMDEQMAEFIDKGGEVSDIPRGLSGHDSALGPITPNSRLFDQPRGKHIPLTDVIKALEARRKRKVPSRKGALKPPSRRPRKKMIYDDFGEPLRWQWVDE